MMRHGAHTRGVRTGFAASALLLCLAFAGPTAGPARPLQSLRLVVSVAWLIAQEQAEPETRPVATRVPQPT